MDYKKAMIYILIILSIIGATQTPEFESVGKGQHVFVIGRNVDCVSCHDIENNDLHISQSYVYDAHLNAAKNKNYTTYLQVGGISYDPAGVIYTNVDSDNSGSNDTWFWNGTKWVYSNQSRLYDLDFNGDGVINGSEICKLCHNLELMGVDTMVSEVHTVGTRFCDDDRCHGNKNRQYNSYLLFADKKQSITSAGSILSKNSVHGNFYNDALTIDSKNSLYTKSHGKNPGNVEPISGNVSASPYTCLGCHSYAPVSGSIPKKQKFSHTDPNAPKSRYT